MSAADADALCTQCGICCDGTLYGSVVLAEGEPARVAPLGLHVIGNEMRQPCPALSACLCGVYAERPRACAEYECALRKSVAAGQSLASALVQVQRVHELVATIRAGFSCAPGQSIWERIVELPDPKDAADERRLALEHAPAIAAVGELLGLARATFEPRFAGAGRR